jgi:protein TonB
VPLAARGVLVALVAFLHVAGAVAFSRLSETSQHNEDEKPLILRANWIEGASPVSPLSSPSPEQAAEPPPEQIVEPPPVVRPAPPPVRPPKTAPIRQTPQSISVPSQPRPIAVDPVPTVPVASGDSILRPDFDISAAVAAATGGGAGGKGEDKGVEGDQGGDNVGPDFKVSYFSNPEPEYPSLSRRLREQGLVRLRVHVTEGGRAGEVTLHTSSGFDRLDRAALEAVKRWRFRPARRAGTPVASWVVVPVRFELQD